MVEKVWGHEEWLVNNDKYCCKKLYLKKGFICSYHFHPIKQETFIPLEGDALMNIRDEEFMLTAPYTIAPNTPHSFYGVTDAVILEVSTHHEDDDVVRINESKRVDKEVQQLQFV